MDKKIQIDGNNNKVHFSREDNIVHTIPFMFLFLILIFLLVSCLSGCGDKENKEVVEVRSEVVEATITAYNPFSGMVVEYKNYRKTIRRKSFISEYVNKIGDTVPMMLITREYNDGSTQSKLVFRLDLLEEN